LRDDLVNRYHFFIPIDCTIKPFESDTTPPCWVFSRTSAMEVSLPRGPLVDLTCEYFNTNRDGFFTLTDIWNTIAPLLQPHLLAGRVQQGDLVKMFDQLVRLELIRIVLHSPTDRTGDPRRPYVRAFVRQMLKQNAPSIPNTVFEILKLDLLSCVLMKQFDGRRSITEHVTEIQKEIKSGNLNVTHKGVTIRADQRDKISKIIEDTVANLRKVRLVT